MQSKQGMIADISRTFGAALSHKTDFIRSQIRRQTFDKSTRAGARDRQASDETAELPDQTHRENTTPVTKGFQSAEGSVGGGSRPQNTNAPRATSSSIQIT